MLGAVFDSAQRQRSLSPTIDGVPPDNFQPFIECDLGPFTATPPMCGKEPRIFGGGDGPMILRQMMHKDYLRAWYASRYSLRSQRRQF
jgi:hypothetical protein